MTNEEKRLAVLRANTNRNVDEEREMQLLIRQGVSRVDADRDGFPVNFDADRSRLAELKSRTVATKEEHREIAILEARLANVPPGVTVETQAEKDVRENRQNKEAAERDEVCKRISTMNDSGWHSLREVLRQHGFSSLFTPDRP